MMVLIKFQQDLPTSLRNILRRIVDDRRTTDKTTNGWTMDTGYTVTHHVKAQVSLTETRGPMVL